MERFVDKALITFKKCSEQFSALKLFSLCALFLLLQDLTQHGARFIQTVGSLQERFAVGLAKWVGIGIIQIPVNLELYSQHLWVSKEG